MRNARLDELQTEIKIGRKSINNLRYVDDTTLMAESEEELKSLLMRVKEESERAGLKLDIKKFKIMSSGSITSRQIEGEKVKVVTDFLFLGSKITVDGDCSHEIRRCLLLGRKAMTNLDSVLKAETLLLLLLSRFSHVRLCATPHTDITLLTKVHIVKAMGFPLSSVGKESAYKAGDLGVIPGLGRSPGEGNGSPLQYSCLENPRDRGAWRATVHGITRVGQNLAAKPPLWSSQWSRMVVSVGS